MMGGHHAVTGAAVWIAATATATHVPSLHLMSLSPAETALGALLCAGAALGPDADHPQATLAHSGGLASKAAAELVGGLAGGHRHGTHAPIVAALVVAAAWVCGHFGLVHPVRFSESWWVCAAVICALMCFAVKVLRVTRSWPVSWLIGIVTAAAVCVSWPTFLPLLPAIIAIGWVTHLAGDLLTTGGLPLAWPFTARPFPGIPSAIWGQNGYVALPILGNAGSWREWLLCAPVSVYVAAGISISLYTLLPR